MTAEDAVTAALVGLDAGEAMTFLSPPDNTDREAFDAACQALPGPPLEPGRAARDDRVPADPVDAPITTTRLRRTLAWFIARRPRGVVAAAIQYGHVSVKMTLDLVLRGLH